MEDYYKILGIDKTASSTQLRASYKKLAMTYHPDHNPGNPEAEEMFKKINEAYHVLSDPRKKLNYDYKIEALETVQVEAYYQELKRRRFYQWKQSQEKRYKLDKEYFKIQGLAFLVFIVISGLCFSIVHTATYFIEQKNLERWRANSLSLKEINVLFGSGRFNDAFSLIQDLKKKDPLEFRFSFAHDSLVTELRKISENDFNHKDFESASYHYDILKNYENPVRFETIRRISLCEYYLGNFKESIQALKHLHNQRPGDLELIYLIGQVNLEKLDNPREALQYFTLGKKLFKKNLSEVYGAAFVMVMDPADAPDIYYDIFEARAKANMSLRNYSEAVNDCNWATYLRPRRGEPYKVRAEAKIKLRMYDAVCSDLMQATRLGTEDAGMMLKKYCR